MIKTTPVMSPATGERLVRFVGDVLTFRITRGSQAAPEKGYRALLRTTIGRGAQLREEIHQAHFKNLPPAGLAWRDLEMNSADGAWSITLPLPEVGYFKAKAYLSDDRGWQHWPDGDDFGVNVLPDWCRSGNTIYCAFPRMFGPNKHRLVTVDKEQEARWKQLDQEGCTVIPQSGKLRDVIRELPHVFDTLGCRILHLLPVGPTPTTMARFGRFGSPYAVQDLTAIDPAVVDFDRRTTGVEQFRELTEAVHLRDGKVILDLVINHTGWGSTLFEQHPEWFVKDAAGKFVSPGAWGTTWEDLVEVNPASNALWDELAEVFLTWCRRGVDGFRCDAGYKVPVLVWQCITARVHEEFPETVFFLEGLGGAWTDTAIRLTEGGMQWAYSEIFQNHTSVELCGYVDHGWKQSGRVGLLINYSETHDNDRLASKGREWSLMRNRVCALASVCGGFGFTNGVEWLAAEKIDVHSARGLGWGNKPNIVNELAALNRLLAGHPCFFDGATLVRLSTPTDPVFAFARISADEARGVLVLANVDLNASHGFGWKKPERAKERDQSPIELLWNRLAARSVDLLSGDSKQPEPDSRDRLEWMLCPGEVLCLESGSNAEPDQGRTYREARARAAFAIQAVHAAGRELDIVNRKWTDLAGDLDADPTAFLAGLVAPAGDTYPAVVFWSEPDRRRMVPVPPNHWLLIRLPDRFRARLDGGAGRRPVNLSAVRAAGEWIAAVPPGQIPGDARLEVEACRDAVVHLAGSVRFLATEPVWVPRLEGIEYVSRVACERTVLLTNGRGGMARINLDLGRVRSKYDCVLGANLNDELPVDRHVFIKRLRVWANANGFISPLNADNLISFETGARAVWQFRVPAGDGRAVLLRMSMRMIDAENTVKLEFTRDKSGTVDGVGLRLTVRFDLEDRNFHWETKRNGGADHHFTSNTRPVTGRIGFEFLPASDRGVRVTADAGAYFAAPEWSERLPHPVETTRGQTGEGDGWSPGWFDLPLNEDDASIAIIATAEPRPMKSPAGKPESVLVDTTAPSSTDRSSADPFDSQLHFAASQFIVRRGDFKSVIAGYPWFLDWGRDTLICARGLVAGGWLEEVRQLLIVFGRFEENGTLPNTIHGADASNRDTSDAPLWYGVVAGELAAATDESVYELKVDGRRTVRDVIANIAAGYLRGTPNGIQVDGESGLVWSPGHFTWMDTNYPAGTPREGYPIEIQALWIRVLRVLARLNAPTTGEPWGTLADRATASMDKLYWLEAKGWYADSLIAKRGLHATQAPPDQVLRSNCLIPVSFGQLSGDRARRCVAAARNYLVVPGALRTLAPLPADPPLPVRGNDGRLLNDPANPYWGHYEGDEDTRRKPAYHNGTAWTWTFPIFCEALVRAHEESRSAAAAARAYLGGMDALLEDGCFGQLPEIVDGDAPHVQRGCDAQAWGATEALRVWRWLNRLRQ